MAEGIKNNEWIKTVFSYHDQKMTSRERYEFERTLELDPFFADAYEGISALKIGDVDKDLRQIDFMKGKKTKILSPTLYLAVAALFLIALVGFFVSQLINKQTFKAASAPESSIYSEKPDSLEREEDYELNFLNYADSTSFLLYERNESISDSDQFIKELTDERPKNTTKKDEKKSSTDAARKVEMTALPSKTPTVKQDLSSLDVPLGGLTIVTDPVVRDESNAEINPQQTTEPATIQEPVRYDEVMTARAGVNANPQPLGGNDRFNAYLSNNTRYPTDVENPKRETLRIQFKVSVTGNPKDFTVSRAPANDAFTREAIRLINNGPRWSPAIKDGIPVEAEVSLRITFKP